MADQKVAYLADSMVAQLAVHWVVQRAALWADSKVVPKAVLMVARRVAPRVDC